MGRECVGGKERAQVTSSPNMLDGVRQASKPLYLCWVGPISDLVRGREVTDVKKTVPI